MQTETTVTHLPGLLVRCLTALEQLAEDIEKPIVFHCSKVNLGPSGPRLKAEMTIKTKNTTRAQRTASSTPAWQARSVRFLFLVILAAGALTAAIPAADAQNPPPVSAPAAAPSTPAPAAAQPTPTAPEAAAPAVAPAAPSSAAAPIPDVQPNQASIGRAQLPQDLSPWGMFLNADIVVKLVMLGLAFASLVTWTVYVAKAFELFAARRQVRRGLLVLGKAATLAQAHEQLRKEDGTAAQLMQAAVQEIRISANARGDGLKERIAWQLERIEMAASRKISRGTGVLATIGSTAPFVGLFGTVWGIMNSFIGISNAHTTNLAVVAPGIAEALLATAFGLVAAIPAVMIYNVLARSTAHYRALLGDASALVMRLVSRDLDRAKLPLAQAAE